MGDVHRSDCKKATDVVMDHSAKDTVCDGLVLESSPSIVNNFAIGLIDNNPVLRGLTPSLPDGSLELKTITTMADRLGVVATTKDQAIVIYKMLFEDHKYSRLRNLEATLAACLCIACGQDKRLSEICSVTDGATKKEIVRAEEYIVKRLLRGHSIKTGGPKEFMVGQGLKTSILGMNNQAVKAVREAILKSKGFDIRSNRISIAAAVVYIVTQLSDDKKPLKDVSFATRVAEGTIRDAYKDLYPHISKIIPSWYATDDDLNNLCSPW